MTEKNEMVKFGEAFRGYSKKDVNEYITKLSIDFAKQAEHFEEQLSHAAREVEAEKEKTREISAKMDELACELYLYSAKYSDEKLARTNAEDKLDTLACELYSSSVRYSGEKHARKNAEDKLDALACETYSYITREKNSAEAKEAETALLLEKVNARVDEILALTKEKCDEIIAGALEEAEKIRAEAASEADSTRQQAREMLRDVSDKYCENVRTFASDAKMAVDALVRDLNSKGEEFASKIGAVNVSGEAGTGKPETNGEEPSVVEENPKEEKLPEEIATSLESMNEKIDAFTKNTIASIKIYGKRK